VQARHCRVLVREPRRLERPVRVRPAGDRVHQAGIDKPRRRSREEGEEEKACQARDDHGVAKQPVALPPYGEQGDGNDRDERPVAPDVHPVGEIDESSTPQDNGLEAVFPAEPHVFLESRQTSAVLYRGRGAPHGQHAHSAVSKPEQSNHDELPSDRSGSAPQPPYQGLPQRP
jgi:hypothetical protein